MEHASRIMRSISTIPRTGRPRSAYSLLELLTVMVIMAILSAGILASISGFMDSTNISQGGQAFQDQLNLARQIASAQNIIVEVRCLKLLPLPQAPASGYTGILLWSPTRGVPLTRVIRLPAAIAISQDTTTFSTLFGTYISSGTMALSTGAAGYVSFTINPSGMLGPLQSTASAPNMRSTTVGIVPARLASANSLSAVHNYMLVQVNPITGATLAYRP
jgi:prepilin-type N-terminal cleavage/methylation domain-containing protein